MSGLDPLQIHPDVLAQRECDVLVTLMLRRALTTSVTAALNSSSKTPLLIISKLKSTNTFTLFLVSVVLIVGRDMTVLLLKSSEGASDDGGWKDVFPGDLHVISPLGFQFVNSEELRVRLEDNSDSYSGLVCTSQRTVEALSRCMTTRQVAGRANIGGFISGLNSGLIFLSIFFIMMLYTL